MPFWTSLRSGHLGLRAFHHILSDPRVQRIPLVLETPSFELPETVWKTEIDMLNQLSELELEEGQGEELLQEMVVGVKRVVKDAEMASGKKGKETKRAGAKKGKGARKRVGSEDEDEGSDT